MTSSPHTKTTKNNKYEKLEKVLEGLLIQIEITSVGINNYYSYCIPLSTPT